MPPKMAEGERTAFSLRLAEYASSANLTRCAVIFHGGEPLLAGVDTLVEFAQSLRAAVGPSVTLDIGLQTNGILITDAAIANFERASIAVSLSIDGPREANDLHRTSKRGRSSFDNALRALELLKAHPKVFAGVIAVVDPAISPEALFKFFASHQLPKLDFLLPDSHHLRPPPGRLLNRNLYENWLVRAFDLWLDKYPHIRLRTFEALLDAAIGLPSQTDAFGLGDVSLITVETDGSYHDLDVLKVAKPGATKLKGTVHSTEIAVVAASAEIEAHRGRLRKDGLCDTCKSCTVVDVCGGGSLPHRYGANGFDNPTVYCREMLSLISHARNRIKSGVSADGGEVVVAGFAESINLAEFERAETASQIISQLLDDAAEEGCRGFREALELVAESNPEYGPVIRKLLACEKDDFVRLAMRPGTIAWHRTVRSVSLGRLVHSIDGSELQPKASYLEFILGQNDLLPGIRSGIDDLWLRAPFGAEILFEDDKTASAARPLVEEARKVIRDWRPALFEEMQSTVSDIQFVRDPSAHPEKIVSFSDNVVPGALYVSVLKGQGFIDPFDLADSLIHEHRHQKLYLLERVSPLVQPTNAKFVSPWREDLRPPSGLLHAAFVFVELRRYWMHVLVHGPDRTKIRAANQISETDANLRAAFGTIEKCPLTTRGRELLRVLVERFASEPLPASVCASSPV